jgi:hypothetical protein
VSGRRFETNLLLIENARLTGAAGDGDGNGGFAAVRTLAKFLREQYAVAARFKPRDSHMIAGFDCRFVIARERFEFLAEVFAVEPEHPQDRRGGFWRVDFDGDDVAVRPRRDTRFHAAAADTKRAVVDGKVLFEPAFRERIAGRGIEFQIDEAAAAAVIVVALAE